jgi:hypothetical protein
MKRVASSLVFALAFSASIALAQTTKPDVMLVDPETCTVVQEVE